jgi:hypothetical protein
MKRAPQVAGLLVLVASVVFCAQKNPKPPKTPPPTRSEARPAAKNPGGPGGGRAGNVPGRVNNPLNPVQRFLNMTPEEQERVLEKAPPAQRVRLQEALDKWNSRPAAQKEFAYRQYQALTRLPPDRQALIQRQMNAFNKLPEERIKPVRQELIRLLRMPPEQRVAHFATSDFTQKYSPQEQQILKDLSTTLPDDYPLAGK